MIDIIEKDIQRPDVVILLDASGSMASQRDSVISTFNGYVQSVKDDANTISLYTFDSMGIMELIYKRPPKKVKPLTLNDYRPNALTPLFDAMGKIMSKFDDNPRNVQFVTHTDGLENDSREWTREGIKKYINRQSEKGWLFVYLGEGVRGQEEFREFTGLKMNFSPRNRRKVMSANAAVTRTYGYTGQSTMDCYVQDGGDTLDVDRGDNVKGAARDQSRSETTA